MKAGGRGARLGQESLWDREGAASYIQPAHLSTPGSFLNGSAWPRVSHPPALVDPKLRAPQVGRAGLIWPVGVQGK